MNFSYSIMVFDVTFLSHASSNMGHMYIYHEIHTIKCMSLKLLLHVSILHVCNNDVPIEMHEESQLIMYACYVYALH